MTAFSPAEVAQYFNVRVPGLKPSGSELRGGCPVHQGKDANFAVDSETGMAFCHSQCSRGWDIISLEQELTGRDFREARDQIERVIGRPLGTAPIAQRPAPQTKPFIEDRNHKSADAVRDNLVKEGWKFVEECTFTDDLRQVRFEHQSRVQASKNRPEKTHRWEHRGADGVWNSTAGGMNIPPYLNSVVRKTGSLTGALLVEGWNKACCAAELGIPAVSMKEIRAENVDIFAGCGEVFIWPDKDRPGLDMASKVVGLLETQGVRVNLIEPPTELPESDDIIDAVEMGFTLEKVNSLMHAARKATPVRITRVEDVPQIETFQNVGIEWDLEGIFARGGFHLLTGKSGAGKTSLVTAAGHAIANGLNFMGRSTSKRPVLMLDAENGLPAVVERCARMGVNTSDDFRIWGQWTGDDPPAPGGAILYEWVERCPVKPVIIVDNLVAFCPGAENDSNEMRKYLAPCRKLTAMGATLIMLHHIGKSDGARDYRGSSDIKASIDIGYKLTNLGDGARLSLMELRAFKQRFTVTPQLTIRYEDGEFSVDQQHAIPKTINERLVDLLKTHPGVSASEFERLAAEQQLGRNRARDFLKTPGVERKEAGGQNKLVFNWTGGHE